MDDTQSYLDALQETSDVNDYISNLKNQSIQNFQDMVKQPIEEIGSIVGIEAAKRLGSSLIDLARNQGVQWSKGVARSAMEKAGVAPEDIDAILKGDITGVMKQKVQSLIDKAKSKVEDVKNDVQDAIQDKVDAVKGKISDIQNQAENAVNDARDTAEDLVNSARNTAEDLVDTARSTVSDAASSVEGAVSDARNLAQSVVGDAQNVAENTLSSARNTLSSAQESLTNVASDVQSNIGTLSQRFTPPELPDFDDIATLENPFVVRSTPALNPDVSDLSPLEQQDYLDVLNGEPTIASNLSEGLYNEAYGARQILLQQGRAIPRSGEVAGELPQRGGFTEPVDTPGTSSNQIGRLLQQDKLKKQAQEQEMQETEPTPETPAQPPVEETSIDEALRQQQETTEETPETPETAPEETPETAQDVVPEVAEETESVVQSVVPKVAAETENVVQSVVPKVAEGLTDAGEIAEGTGIGDLIAPALIVGGVLASIFGASESAPHYTPINPSTQFV
jgi:cell division septum initiation protein DivIVA